MNSTIRSLASHALCVDCSHEMSGYIHDVGMLLVCPLQLGLCRDASGFEVYVQ